MVSQSAKRAGDTHTAAGEAVALHIAYLAPELGAVTSTFVHREIRQLRRFGITVTCFSTHHPKDCVVSDEAEPFLSETTFLYKASLLHMAQSTLRQLARGPAHFMRVAATAARDAVVGKAPSITDRLKLFWHLGRACLLAERLRQCGATHVHAHFAHVPTSIAMYAAMLSGKSFSFTAHANDIFERGALLKEKVRRAAFVVCISEYNRLFLIERGCDPARLCVVRCGIDLTDYIRRKPTPRSGPVMILSVGRLVEKKGIGVLVRALRILKARGVAFRCKIVGEGPLGNSIREQIHAASLEDTVELLGSRPQEEVKALFAEADLFVLPCVIAAGGDRDGIPVVLMEAMALGVPVISTAVSGIPELIYDGKNGLLAEAGNSVSLAETITSLIENPALAARLAEEARRTVEADYELARNTAMLERKFRETAAQDQRR